MTGASTMVDPDPDPDPMALIEARLERIERMLAPLLAPEPGELCQLAVRLNLIEKGLSDKIEELMYDARRWRARQRSLERK